MGNQGMPKAMFLSFWQNYEQLSQFVTVNIASGRPASVQGCLVPMRPHVQTVSRVIAPPLLLFLMQIILFAESASSAV